jgi:FAD-linked sulfhydryl oxidase
MEEPADVTELGRSAWTFLHTLAAYYPELPTAAERERTSRLLRDFAESYPCHVCRDEFVEEVRKSPPPVTSRAELAQWMCRQHNIVNARLEKPQFPCERVDERWRWPSE